MNRSDLDLLNMKYNEGLEHQLKIHQNNLANMDRMAEQAFKMIEERCRQDKDSFAKVFQKLTTNEEIAIAALREELGMDKEIPKYQGLMTELNINQAGGLDQSAIEGAGQSKPLDELFSKEPSDVKKPARKR